MSVHTSLHQQPVHVHSQAASLELMPHVSAPGAYITVRTQENSTTRSSGTSFSSPYISGSLAIWLQQQREAAATGGSSASPLLHSWTTSQDTALRALVATAAAVPDADKGSFLEPLAKVGAGEVPPNIRPRITCEQRCGISLCS
jgi:hypothetical protein